MRSLLLLACVLSAGCSIGFGSSFVGQYRAREVAEFEVCIEDPTTGECEDRQTITRQEPARAFWGLQLDLFRLGTSVIDVDGETQVAVRFETGAELLRGWGRFAVGLRQSYVGEGGASSADTFGSAPLMAVGHYGLSDRLSLYGAAGYSWRQLYAPVESGRNVDHVSHLGGRALFGLQLVGAREEHDIRAVYTLEVDTSLARVDGSTIRSSGATFSAGIFF